MRFSLAKLLVRLTSGLGVLLLGASQEKVCPWLDEVPVPARQAAGEQPGQPGEDPTSREVPPPSLASTLPDVVAPRRPDGNPFRPLQLDRGRHDPSALSGRLAGDDVSGAWPFGVQTASCGEPRPEPGSVPCCAVPGGQVFTFRPLALLTSVFINGPPID
jgi:hypothetical protein